MCKPSFLTGCLFLATIFVSSMILAYPVRYPFNLEQLNKQADVILKVTVVDSKPVENAWFETAPGFKVVATEMNVISSVKGELSHDTIQFHHYTEDRDGLAAMYMPQYYSFEKGRSYIVLAKRTDDPKVYRQCWIHHTMKYDQGVVLTLSNDRTIGDSLKEVYWEELTAFLESAADGNPVLEDDLIYAVSQLDQMSSSRHDAVQHFDRLDVLKQVATLIKHSHNKVALKAIEVLGGGNPYTRPENEIFWLATYGSGHLPGLGEFQGEFFNAGGSLYWRDLVEVANSDVPAEIQATAIRALGRADRAEIWPHIKNWLGHDVALVREAATVLLGDFNDAKSKELLAAAMNDDCAKIRRAAAQAIGYGQRKDCLEMLEPLLTDQNEIAATAALCLVSFSPDLNREIIKRNIGHKHFGIVFINVLAVEDPEPYVEALCEYVINNDSMGMSMPPGWWGGSIPWGQSWERLLAYANARSEMEIQAEEFEPILEALEHAIVSPNSHDGKARVGSQIPTGIYQLYIQNGLTERAEKFRAICKENVSYDVDHYFNQIHKK